MKKISIAILIIASIPCSGQRNNDSVSLSDEIRRNFSYDTLSYLSCLNTPPGIYLVKFQVDGKGYFSEFKSNNDSLADLNRIFIDAIQKCSLLPGSVKLKKGTYLQTIYFNNVLHCNPFRGKDNVLQVVVPDTTVKFDVKVDKDIADMLNGQLKSIENSIANLDFQKFGDEKITLLPIVLINNENPNAYRGPGFRNDTRKIDFTKAEIDKIQKLIEEKRRSKDGN
jgi:hypothetical protein